MIQIDQLTFSIGDFQLRRISLDVPQGQYFVMLGPPGSGKSVLLECLCGLKRVKSGRIYIDEQNVTNLEPRLRPIGYVPQDYALFPHLSVEHNIAFGLRSHSERHEAALRKVIQTAEMLGIRHLLKRSVYGLSGGERQRVALARVLVLRPKVLLLDEPVSALDEATRQDVCAQLHHIQRQFGLTTIHVSHNVEEAFSVADRAGILHQGALQQIGSMGQLLRRPKNEFVARFMRCDNLFHGEVIDDGPEPKSTMVRVGKVQLIVPGQYQGKVKFLIRPENVLLLPYTDNRCGNYNRLKVKMMNSRDRGSYVRTELEGWLNLVAHLPHAVFDELKAKRHSDLVAVLRLENIHVLPE